MGRIILCVKVPVEFDIDIDIICVADNMFCFVMLYTGGDCVAQMPRFLCENRCKLSIYVSSLLVVVVMLCEIGQRVG